MIAEDGTDRANPAAIDPRKKPRADQRRVHAPRDCPAPKAEALLADLAPRPPAAAIVALLLYTGLRVGELAGADVEQPGHDRGHRVLKLTAKVGGERLVALPAPVTRRLDAYLATRTDLTGPLPMPVGQADARPRRPLARPPLPARNQR